MRFTNSHGLGNDFVLFDLRDGLRGASEGPSPLDAEWARKLCDRRLGIGADGVLGILHARTPEARARMAIRNADGSEPEMCGNGIRCVAKWLYDREIREPVIPIETAAGILSCRIHEGREGRAETVSVDMGRAKLHGVEQPLEVNGHRLCVTDVSVGNPHAVVFIEDAADLRVLAETLGPLVERHPRYPDRVNVEFARVHSAFVIELVVWERGCGITLACGTGASATVATAVALHKLAAGREIEVRLSGGSLWIQADPDLQKIVMRGAAVEVFSGEVDLARR